MARFMTLGPVSLPDGTTATRPSFFDDDWHSDTPADAIPVTQAQVDHYVARQPWCHWDAAAGDWVDEPVPVDPTPTVAVSGDALIGSIAKADRAKCDLTDLARIAWRDDVPATNNKLRRIADALGTTPDALRRQAMES